MNLILLLFVAVPQEYTNLLLGGNYEAALGYCNERIAKGKDVLTWQVEKGDIYYDKYGDYEKAAEIHQNLIDNHGDEDGWLHYRLALALEMREDYLNAAKAYEIVATQFRTPPLDSFSLTGVERCFKKNYQDYVASVDGYKFTRLELDEKLTQSSYLAQKGERSVVDQMILQRLIYSNALKENADDTEFFQDGRDDARKELYLEEIRNHDIIAKSEPTDKEMESYYKKNKENYALREEVRGKEIIVASDTLARYLLDTLHKDIESFDTLAKFYSTAQSNKTGGNMGVVYRGTKPEPVDEVLFKTEVNTLTDVVRFDSKYGIFLITGYKPKRYREYENVVSQVRNAVKAEKIEELEKKFTKSLRKKAKIKVYKNVVKNPMESEEDKLAAVVSKREIWKNDVVQRNQSQIRMAQADLSNPEEFEKLLNTIIDEQLKLEFAERNKYFLYDGYVNKMRDNIQTLLENGLYRIIVIEGVTADSQEIADFYNEHKEEYRVPETIRARELVVESKELAEELRQLLLETPEAFDSLAREHSIAQNKADGGKTGVVRRGMRSDVFESNVFGLEIGTMSKIFTEKEGMYTFALLMEHQPETYRALEEMSRSIETSLLRQKRNTVATEYLDLIKEQADIEIYLPEPVEEGTSDQGE